MLAEHALNSLHLRHIAERRTRTVRIDEINLLGLQIGILQRQAHHALCTLTFRIRCGHVIGVRGHSFADNLRVDLCATGFGVLVVLQNEASSTFAQHKAVAALGERTTGGSGILVVGREGVQRVEAADTRIGHIRVRTAGQQHIRMTQTNLVKR